MEKQCEGIGQPVSADLQVKLNTLNNYYTLFVIYYYYLVPINFYLY